MAESLGDFSAYMTPGGARFQGMKNGKKALIPRADVPPAVAEILERRLKKEERGEVPKFAMPTEEEKAKLREESLKVPENLQMTEEQIVAQEAKLQEVIDIGPLTGEDFDTTDVKVIHQSTVDEITKHVENTPEYHKGYAEASEVMSPSVDADFLESVSIHTASLQDIAHALLDRFGIYTVYLGELPVGDEFNPLTGEPFTKYHLGIAYQGAMRAINTGILNKDPESGRQLIDNNRYASEHVEQQFVPVARTMGEARRENSFAYRTSVRGMNEQSENLNGAVSRARREDEDEPILEPQLGKQIIRPDW